MFLLETSVGLSLSICRWNVLPQHNINMYANNTLLSSNPKRMKNMQIYDVVVEVVLRGKHPLPQCL